MIFYIIAIPIAALVAWFLWGINTVGSEWDEPFKIPTDPPDDSCLAGESPADLPTGIGPAQVDEERAAAARMAAHTRSAWACESKEELCGAVHNTPEAAPISPGAIEVAQRASLEIEAIEARHKAELGLIQAKLDREHQLRLEIHDRVLAAENSVIVAHMSLDKSRIPRSVVTRQQGVAAHRTLELRERVDRLRAKRAR